MFDPYNITDIDTKVTAKIHEFSNESIHLPGKDEKTKYSGRKKLLKECFRIKFLKTGEINRRVCYLNVFANGHSEENKGHVTVLYRNTYKNCKTDFTISVIDASGNERFTQTFTTTDMEENQCIPFISRESLLRNAEDFLPNDILTLMIDMHVRSTQSAFKIEIEESKAHEEVPHTPEEDIWLQSDGHCTIFNLDCPLGKRLAEESSFFRGILSIPVAEQSTKGAYVPIPVDEFWFFIHISRILLENNPLILESIKGVFDLIIVADKYDIPAVTESCRAFLKLCLFDHTIDKYLEIADQYENEILKDLIIKEINSVSHTDFEKETVKVENGGVCLKEPIGKVLWHYAFNDPFLCFRNFYKPITEAFEYEVLENHETFL